MWDSKECDNSEEMSKQLTSHVMILLFEQKAFFGGHFLKVISPLFLCLEVQQIE